GAQIEVNGTEASPVVITSAKIVGSRERGDWGGLVLCGRSSHNLLDGAGNNNVQIEGFNGVSFDPSIAKIGGTVLNDNSGTIHYLRLEFGGLAFEANKEINGLTFGAIGSATVVNHVQVSYSGDDSFEWFGGKVNSSHLIAFKGTDDDFDTDNGYGGLSQFGLAVRDSAYYDLTYAAPSGGSTSEGFESDNEATGTAAVKPYTNAIFSNFTMVGPIPVGSSWSSMNSTTKAAFRRGARIRRNSSLRVVNSIFLGYRNFLMIDGDSSIRNTNFPALLALVSPSTPVDVQTKQIFFTNNLIVNSTNAFNTAGDTVANGLVEVTRAKGSLLKLTALDAWVKASGSLSNNINPVPFTTGTVLVNPLAASTTPDFRPVAGSPALAGANFDANPILSAITPIHDVATALTSPIYPNPITNGTLHFGHQVVAYGIFDVKGQLVQYGLDTDHANIDGFATGIYFIKLDGKVQKLIVE
ncbi:MAG: T9SS type A sorting domain-containing protein, partial [Saprospiraceae bacterium]